jgi:hypothetical protein
VYKKRKQRERRFNLISSSQNRSPDFSHSYEALIFWYFFIKEKVQKTKKCSIVNTQVESNYEEP